MAEEGWAEELNLPAEATDMSQWHAVMPLRSCPHCTSVASAAGLELDLSAPCRECGNRGENMLCLGCHQVFCGRHVEQHMLKHYESEGHPLVCGFLDLSIWCYECEAYIVQSNPSLLPYYAALHTAKFGEPPPGVAGATAEETGAAAPKPENAVDELASQIAKVDLQGEPAPASPVSPPPGIRPYLPPPYEVEGPAPLLPSFDIEGVVEYIKQHNCKNIVVMTGAGVSTAAGIPDFRTPGTGLYSNLQKYDLPRPEAIFTLDYFRGNPDPFFLLARELWPGKYRATRFHHLVRLLDEKGLLLRNYTQNIDGLEGVAGLKKEKVIEAHGGFSAAHCINPQCAKEYPIDFVQEHVFADPPKVPHCTACDGGGTSNLVKPDITFFGEGLPDRFHQNVGRDLGAADLLIVAGTSLQVQPFASLVRMVGADVPRLVMNREEVGTELGLKYGEYRDAFFPGPCDDGATRFAEAMGWRDDLNALQTEFDRQFDEKNAASKARF